MNEKRNMMIMYTALFFLILGYLLIVKNEYLFLFYKLYYYFNNYNFY